MGEEKVVAGLAKLKHGACVVADRSKELSYAIEPSINQAVQESPFARRAADRGVKIAQKVTSIVEDVQESPFAKRATDRGAQIAQKVTSTVEDFGQKVSGGVETV